MTNFKLEVSLATVSAIYVRNYLDKQTAFANLFTDCIEPKHEILLVLTDEESG